MFGKILFGILAILLSQTAGDLGDERVQYIFYHGPHITETTTYNVAWYHEILNHPLFNHTQETLVFHFGTGQFIVTPEVHAVITAYYNSRKFNLIVINYDDTSIINTDNANSLAHGITVSHIRLFDHGYNSALMNFLGFGMGGQIMARASRRIQAETNRRHIVGRLTGLEPFVLGPVEVVGIGRLSAADAQFVETVHTDDSGNRGDIGSNGHVAFFVNGASQMQCNQVNPGARATCNHNYALTYWAEQARSLTPVFPSLLCDSFTMFMGGFCNNNPQAFMGRTTELSNRGFYMLKTNMISPYSRDTAFP